MMLETEIPRRDRREEQETHPQGREEAGHCFQEIINLYWPIETLSHREKLPSPSW